MLSLRFQGRRSVQLRRPGDKLLRKPLSSSWPETLSIGKNWGLTWTPEWRSQRKEGASTDSNTKRCAPPQYLHRIWTYVLPISCESLQPTLKDTFLKVLIFAPFSVHLYSEQSTRGKSSAEIESNPSGRPRQEEVSAWGHHGKVPQGHGTHRLQGQTSQETKVNSFELQSYEANILLFSFVSGRRSDVPVQCGFSFIGHIRLMSSAKVYSGFHCYLTFQRENTAQKKH